MYARMWFTGMAVAMAGLAAGCANFPQMPDGNITALQTQASAAGATLPASDSVITMLVDGKLGADNGTLIAADWTRIQEHQSDEAVHAANQARTHPATAAEVRHSTTADLNGDGFVTLDEIVAMHKAGLSRNQIINRLERTFYHFELTPPQRQYLRAQGVKPEILAAIDPFSPGTRTQTASLDLAPR